MNILLYTFILILINGLNLKKANNTNLEELKQKRNHYQVQNDQAFDNDSKKKIINSDKNLDFEFITCEWEKEIIVDAYKAITGSNGWEFIKNYKVQDEGTFGKEIKDFSSIKHSKIFEIKNKLEIKHSKSTFNLVMQFMQQLAHYGYDEFKKKY